MLYEFVLDHDIEKDVVSFATDSIITTKKIEIDSEKLGAFKFENSGDDVYVLQNGIYRFKGIWKKRGICKLGGFYFYSLSIYSFGCGKIYLSK